MAVLIILALLTVASLPENEFSIVSSYDGSEDIEQVVNLEEMEVPLEALQPEEVTFQSAMNTDTSALMAGELGAVDPVGDMAPSFSSTTDMLANAGLDGDGLLGEGEGSGSMTSFFGAKSRGDRVVFIVDASNSMVGGRIHTTLMEIARSVSEMKSKQQFYVILFGDQAYPMFFPEPVHELLPANKKNKELLNQWLPTVEMCRGGAVVEAVEMTAEFRPQVIYLLSDGEIPTEAIERRKSDRGWRFVINTFGMTVPNNEAEEKMKSLAATFGGVYRPVEINPVAAALARERPIPRNTKPGPVWGTRIRN